MNNQEIALNLRKALKDRGIEQTDASKRLSISHRTFQRYLSGDSKINFDLLDDVENILGISTKSLISDVESGDYVYVGLYDVVASAGHGGSGQEIWTQKNLAL
jgi:transcriptional regulator with XRE-family HTH domain